MHDFDEDASIDLTPVIDVIFMLLIFFIMNVICRVVMGREIGVLMFF